METDCREVDFTCDGLDAALLGAFITFVSRLDFCTTTTGFVTSGLTSTNGLVMSGLTAAAGFEVKLLALVLRDESLDVEALLIKLLFGLQ